MKKISTLFKDEAIRKVLLFFNDNPHSIDTAKGISLWVGSSADTVQKALNKLVDEGILVNHKTASIDAYAYTNDRYILKKIEEYIKKI